MTWLIDLVALLGIGLIGIGASFWGWHVAAIVVGVLLLGLSQAYAWRLLRPKTKG